MISLHKTIATNSWRHLGRQVTSVGPSTLPIGGCSIRRLHGVLGGKLLKIGRISTSNAFVVEIGNFRLVYVNPRYRGYRRAAGKVFNDCPWPIDYDHLLSAKLAAALGFSYVLIARILPQANRSHGRLERLPSGKVYLSLHSTCLADARILSKWINRRPSAGHLPYRSVNVANIGLTLKQKGVWAFSLGFEGPLSPNPSLSPF